MRTHRIEWLGVKSATDDPVVTYRMMRGMHGYADGYTAEQIAALEMMGRRSATLVRAPGFSRTLGPKDGLSQTYTWDRRNRWFCAVLEIDAERIDRLPCTAEFRDHDNPAHDGRVAQVAEPLMTKAVHDVLKGAANGAPVHLTQTRVKRYRERLPNSYPG